MTIVYGQIGKMSTVEAAILFLTFTIHLKLESTASVNKFTAFCFHCSKHALFFFPIFGTLGTGVRFIVRGYLEPAYIFSKTLRGQPGDL